MARSKMTRLFCAFFAVAGIQRIDLFFYKVVAIRENIGIIENFRPFFS